MLPASWIDFVETWANSSGNVGKYPPTWVFPKIVGFPPKSSHSSRVFHYFHHPFWGTPFFGNTHMEHLGWLYLSYTCRVSWCTWLNFFGYLQDVWGVSEVKMVFLCGLDSFYHFHPGMALSYACHPLSNSTCSGFLLESRSIHALHSRDFLASGVTGERGNQQFAAGCRAVSCTPSMGGGPVEILHRNDEKFPAVQCHGSSSSRWRCHNLCLPVTTPLSESPLVKQHTPQLRTHTLECSSGSGAPISEPMSQEKNLDIGFSHLEKNLSSTLRIANVGKFTKGAMAPWKPMGCNLGCICKKPHLSMYILSHL